MKAALIDTDLISFYLRNHSTVKKHLKEYILKYPVINFSIISYYEILSGLKYKDAHKQLKAFLEFSDYCNILTISEVSIEISADIYSDLRKRGQIIDDIDILIAGIALANGLIIVTHNVAHFKRIENLIVEDWTMG